MGPSVLFLRLIPMTSREEMLLNNSTGCVPWKQQLLQHPLCGDLWQLDASALGGGLQSLRRNTPGMGVTGTSCHSPNSGLETGRGLTWTYPVRSEANSAALLASNICRKPN